jgi:Flp pilus assembly protein TadD
MHDLDCASDADLQAFVLGELPEAFAAVLAAHLEGCPRCEAAARRLDAATDPAVRALRRAFAGAAPGTEAGRDDRTPAPAGQASGITATAALQPGAAAPDGDGLPARVAGYTILARLGLGGMGVVYKARQQRPDRLVALKMLPAGEHGGPEWRARLLAEAEALARVQHPHILQIHGVGEQEGRAFLVLEYAVHGSLAERLKEAPLPPPAAARLVETLAEAVHFAHERGIVHRDLKPGNILLASGGRKPPECGGSSSGDSCPALAECVPKVADFGLAKLVGGGTGLTCTGMILGTPSYMAPEQADGQGKEAGPATDVYALGAILYECLTGRPPFRAASQAATLRQVLSEEPLSPRRLDSSVPRDLDTVCLKCLEKEPARRYASAQALAEDLARFGTGQPLRARPVGPAGKAVKWVRRNPVGAGLVAALMLLAVGAAGVLWWAQQQHEDRAAERARRRQAADGAVAVALGQARLLLEQARATPLTDAGKFNEALATATSAAELTRAAEVSDELRQEVAELVATLRDEGEAAERDRRLLAALAAVRGPREGPMPRRDDSGQVTGLAQPGADEQFQAAFRAWDEHFDADALPTDVAAARLRARPPAVVSEVVAALDEWAGERRQDQTRRQNDPAAWQRRCRSLEALAAALDDDAPDRRQLRDMLARGTLQRERALGLLSVALRPVPVPFDVGPGEDQRRLRQWAAEARQRVATEPVLRLLTLARALQAAGDDALAEALLRAAVDARPQELALHAALGKFLEDRQPPRWAEAVRCYEAARALRPAAGEALAQALVLAGDGVAGLALYDQLVAQRPDNPWLHGRRGIALNRLGRHEEAAAAYRQTLRLQPDYAEAWTNLGITLDDLGRLPEAEAALRQALRCRADFPEAYLAHNSLGVVLERQGRLAEAEAAYREAIRLKPDEPNPHANLSPVLGARGRHVEAEAEAREAVRLRPEMSVAHLNLGAALYAQDRFPDAEAEFRESVRLRPNAPARCNLGNALHRQGRTREAEAAFREALRLKPDYPEAYTNLGMILMHSDRLAEAEACCREAVRLKPDFGLGHYNLARVLGDCGRNAEAEAEYREALRLEPDNIDARLNLGHVLNEQHRHKEAEAVCREAIRRQPQHPTARVNLGLALAGQGRLREAEAEYRAALRIKPDAAVAHHNLADALFGQGRVQEAEPEYREAIRLRPEQASYNSDLGALLTDGLHRYKEAEALFRQAIRLDPRNAEWHCNLGNALFRQNRLEEAEAAFREALRLKPGHSGAQNNLAYTLRGRGRLREAEAAFRAVIRLKPDVAALHFDLGDVLADQGRFEEAEAAFREVVRLRPDYPLGHVNVGYALANRGRPREAEAAYREAIRLQPDLPLAHNGLGAALLYQGRHKEAEAAQREAIRLQPAYPDAYHNLGSCLAAQARYKEAEAAYREAVRLRPNFARTHYDLAATLSRLGRLPEAEAAYREAIRLRPDYAEAHCNLGALLRRQGRLAEALKLLRRGHELGTHTPGWHYPSAEWVAQCERLAELEQRLPQVRKGDARPASAAEALEFAALCSEYLHLPLVAARLYAAAFAAAPALAGAPQAMHRYNAACAAVRAAVGGDRGAGPPPDKSAALLRRQALAWLRQDLTLHASAAGRPEPAGQQLVRTRLALWERDDDLAPVRALAQLPDAERADWRRLWDDVAALRRRLGEPK